MKSTPNDSTSQFEFKPVSHWCPARFARLPALHGWILCLFLACWINPCSGLRAQDNSGLTQTNDAVPADVSAAADNSQPADAVMDDQTVGTNDLAETNQISAPGPDGRTRRLQRRPPRPRTANQNQDRVSSASTNGTPSGRDYSAFRLIADRNIFDPNRSPRDHRSTEKPKTSDSFTLVGTMSYEKGIFAFFDGTSSDYKKVLKPQESIAGYKVASISSDAIKLARDTNVLELRVGTQMRRRDDGSWEQIASSASYASSTSSSSSSSTDAVSSGGAESDTLRKLRERREKE
jgi:hypothetical protein